MNPDDIVYLNSHQANFLYQQLKAAVQKGRLTSLRFHPEGDGTIKWKVNEWCWEPAYGCRETERKMQ